MSDAFDPRDWRQVLPSADPAGNGRTDPAASYEVGEVVHVFGGGSHVVRVSVQAAVPPTRELEERARRVELEQARTEARREALLEAAEIADRVRVDNARGYGHPAALIAAHIGDWIRLRAEEPA